jgi:hypothetical protein
VLVVPECASSVKLEREPGVSFAWRGEYQHKGLGVFGFNGWKVDPLPEADPRPWCMPLSVTCVDSPIALTLLAVWTVKRNGDGRPGYAAQFADVLQRWGSLIATRPVIVAGDLNASLQGPSARLHRDNLEMVHALGARSAFHHHHDVEHGLQEPPTLRWIGPGRTPYEYHCDYIFLSSQLVPLLTDAAVGSAETWIDSGRSDHCPVTVDLELDEVPFRSGT